MRNYIFTVQPNVETDVSAVGDFVRIQEATGRLSVSTYGSDEMTMVQGQSVHVAEPFAIVRIRNLEASPQTVNLLIGRGEFNDNQLSGSISTVTPTVLNAWPDAPVPSNTNTPIAPLSPTRKALIVKNLISNTVEMRVGDIFVASNAGHELAPGESVVLDTTAAVFAYWSGTGVQYVSLLEIRA